MCKRHAAISMLPVVPYLQCLNWATSPRRTIRPHGRRRVNQKLTRSQHVICKWIPWTHWTKMDCNVWSDVYCFDHCLLNLINLLAKRVEFQNCWAAHTFHMRPRFHGLLKVIQTSSCHTAGVEGSKTVSRTAWRSSSSARVSSPRTCQEMQARDTRWIVCEVHLTHSCSRPTAAPWKFTCSLPWKKKFVQYLMLPLSIHL